jgi:transposase InsO family protein
MRIVSNVTGPMLRVARQRTKELSREANCRLDWFEHDRRHHNVSFTCRHFGISRQTFYRWKRRYHPLHLQTLESRSSCPKRHRLPTWTTEQILAVKAIRERYPSWGKAKLQWLLRREGTRALGVDGGRIPTYLRTKRAPRVDPRSRRANTIVFAPTPSANRGVPAAHPGRSTPRYPPVPYAVQQLPLTMSSSLRRSGAARATAKTGPPLAAVLARMPLPVKAIQIDGGSEFMAEFEESCRDHGVQLFVLPPRSPKLNGCVERGNRTHTEEFYEWTTAHPSVAGLTPALREWEQVYNTIRPHQALGYLTPIEFLRNHAQRREEVSPR